MIRRNVDAIAIAILIAGTLLCSAVREQAEMHRVSFERAFAHDYAPEPPPNPAAVARLPELWN